MTELLFSSKTRMYSSSFLGSKVVVWSWPFSSA